MSMKMRNERREELGVRPVHPFTPSLPYSDGGALHASRRIAL
jgi:hypothetical protein